MENISIRIERIIWKIIVWILYDPKIQDNRNQFKDFIKKYPKQN